MKLSQAMRRGSKMAKQTFGTWSRGDGGCALMLSAIGAEMTTLDQVAFDIARGMIFLPTGLMDKYPFLPKPVEAPCTCSKDTWATWNAIIHLNDVHRWPAERIAGWIEAHIEVPTYSMLDMQQYMVDVEEVAHV